MSREEELPNPGLTVTFLKRMEDVTERVLEGVTPSMKDDERDMIIDSNIKVIREQALEGNDFTASVRPFRISSFTVILFHPFFR